MINITVKQAYVPYTDHCTNHHLNIVEGHVSHNVSILEKFCGHSSNEVIYTKGNKAVVQISTSHTGECMYLFAVYQVHIKGWASKFYQHHLLYPLAWHISIPYHLAYKIFFKDLYHLIWFYTRPVITHKPVLSQNSDTMSARSTFSVDKSAIKTLWYTNKDGPYYAAWTGYTQTSHYLFIQQFTCNTKRSMLYIQDGLVHSKTENQQAFQCNRQYPFIPLIKKHQYTRVDLYLDLVDPNVNYTMTLHQSESSQAVKMIEVLGDTSSSIYQYHYDSPLIYYSVDSYLTLTVTSFSYEGRRHNVMADYIHSLPLFEGWKNTAFLPKGWDFYIIMHINVYFLISVCYFEICQGST
jgi:hypothetical protein